MNASMYALFAVLFGAGALGFCCGRWSVIREDQRQAADYADRVAFYFERGLEEQYRPGWSDEVKP